MHFKLACTYMSNNRTVQCSLCKLICQNASANAMLIIKKLLNKVIQCSIIYQSLPVFQLLQLPIFM